MIPNGYRSISTMQKFLSVKPGDIINVIDTETTGLSAEKERVLEFAAEKLFVTDDYELKLIEAKQIYINPGFPIPPKSVEVHHITDEFIADKPSEEEVFADIYKYIEGGIVAGQNVAFDIRFLSAMWQRNGKSPFDPPLILDTLQAARDLVDSKSVPDHHLQTIAKLYGADEGIVFHSAKDDVRATSKLLQVFLDEYRERESKKAPVKPQTAEEMLASIKSRQAELPKKVPFIKGMQVLQFSKTVNRIYFYTDCGSFYWDKYYKSWGHDPKKLKVPYETIDMEKFIKRAMWLAKCSTEEELGRVKTPDGTVWFNNNSK